MLKFGDQQTGTIRAAASRASNPPASIAVVPETSAHPSRTAPSAARMAPEAALKSMIPAISPGWIASRAGAERGGPGSGARERSTRQCRMKSSARPICSSTIRPIRPQAPTRATGERFFTRAASLRERSRPRASAGRTPPRSSPSRARAAGGTPRGSSRPGPRHA